MNSARSPGIWNLVATVTVLLLAMGCTWIFWAPLWNGGGLIGGDLYPYYFPQKAFLADSLRNGLIPVWNPLVGFGYPTLGESQTGVLYPPNLILYRFFDLNTAYNVSQLGHYILAFMATWGLGRRLRLKLPAAVFTAVAFVFGWFPARICLEWAIIGGAWFVAILWAETVYLQSRQTWAICCLSIFLGLDLLAGHYNLAFITILTGMIWPWIIGARSSGQETSVARPLGMITIAVALGFLIAAVQLVPTWELKTVSQRQEVNQAFTPTYGHLPPRAISQLWMPWAWHAGEKTADDYLAAASFLAVPDATNQVEAFLYCGSLTLLLAVLGFILKPLHVAEIQKWKLAVLLVLGLIFATGWPTYYLTGVPGFGFFRGPGRYSIVTALALALLGGYGLNVICDRLHFRGLGISLFSVFMIAVLLGDLWLASRKFPLVFNKYFDRQVFYATLVDEPPINHLADSELKAYFKSHGDKTRLYAFGQNVPTMLGVSALPVYLGLGPQIYETDQLKIDFSLLDPTAINESRHRLLKFGVTHILTENAIDTTLWNVELIARPADKFLMNAFAAHQPFHLYQINGAHGRAFIMGRADVDLEIRSTPHTVELTVPAGVTGDLMLADLSYPGWICETHETIDDDTFRIARVEQSNEPQTVRWTYRPWSVFVGIVLSILGLLGAVCAPNLIAKVRSTTDCIHP